MVDYTMEVADYGDGREGSKVDVAKCMERKGRWVLGLASAH